MAGLIEDLLAGLPQAYNTLEELLAQSKLGRQHYGPRDSMIASAIAHPGEGIQKAGQWLQDQMMTAGQSPVQPMTDPRGAEAGGLAGLNLAGLMQTGGLPFGPKSSGGTLGTILVPGMPDYPESAAAKAAEELAQGASVEDIWQKYKLYPWQNNQGKRVLLGEIPDYKASLSMKPLLKEEYTNIGKVTKLPNVLSHEQLYRNQPELENVSIMGYKNPYSETAASYVPSIDVIKLNLAHPAHKQQTDIIGSLLHEITHVQQNQKKLPQGTTPEVMRAVLNMQKKKEGMAGKPEGYQPRFGEFNTTTPKEAFAAYENAAGEAQARMTQDRFKIGKKRTGPGLMEQISPLNTMANVDRHPVESLLWGYTSGTKQDLTKSSKARIKNRKKLE